MIGIDNIAFATSDYFIDMKDLAEARGVSVDKYYIGIGQKQMSVIPPDEDIVTLGYAAARQILDKTDDIGLFIFATESSIDQSKSAATFLMNFLNLPSNCVAYEIKQACYGGTAALFSAFDYVAMNPGKRALVIASDVARYAKNTPGEATQGCGAVAMIISETPKILSLNRQTGVYSSDSLDFYRPNFAEEAIVDGAFSARLYIKSLKNCLDEFADKSSVKIDDIDYFCYHTPFVKMATKAHSHINVNGQRNIGQTLIYNSTIGNTYTASLYISLISLLDNIETNLSQKIIGFFSYGSGSVGQFFTGQIVNGYEKLSKKSDNIVTLSNRQKLSVAEYEMMIYDKKLLYKSHHKVDRIFACKNVPRVYNFVEKLTSC